MTIDRLSCRYLVAGDHPDPAGVEARLDTAARRLAGRCAAALPRAVDTGDPSVWVIRRLDLGVTLPVDTDDPDLLAQLWASGIAARIAAVVQGRVELPDAVRYPSRAAYLASFAADLARGDAWQRWQYAGLAGLATTRPGQAMVSAAAEMGVPAVELVELLARTRRLDRVLTGLGEAATPLWWGCAAPAVVADLRTIAAVRDRRAAATGLPGSAEVARLRLLGTMLATAPPPAPAPALAAAVDLVVRELEETTTRPAAASPGAVVEAPAPAPGWPERPARVPAPQAPVSDPPRQDSTTSPVAAPRRAPTRLEVRSLSSPWLGVVRLMPSLLTVCDQLTGPDRASALVRHRVLVRCAGNGLAGRLSDPALRLVSGLDPDEPVSARLPPEDVTGPDRILGQVPGQPADADLDFLGSGTGDEADRAVSRLAAASIRHFARTLLGFGGASAAHLAANVYLVPGTVTADPNWHPSRLDVVLEPAPLQVVLDLAGISTLSCALPWPGPSSDHESSRGSRPGSGQRTHTVLRVRTAGGVA